MAKKQTRKRSTPAIPTECELKWREHISAAQAEGLKLGAYCDLKGLVKMQAFWWRAEIRRRDRIRRASGADSQPAFLPVVLERPAPVRPVHAAAALRIALPGGRMVEVAGDFDEQVLGKLVRVLEGLSC